MDRFPLTNGSQVEGYIKTNPTLAIPYLCIIFLSMVIGIIGNLMVIASVLVNKDLRTVGNIFIVNLAVADFSVTGFVDPFSIVGVVEGGIWFEERPVLCELIASVCLTSCFCSLLSIGAISFNRYIHICHHKYYDRIYTPRQSIAICFCLWIISFLFEMPNFVGWGDHVYDKKSLVCIWDRTANLSYTIFFATVGVLFPILLISMCYLRIYLHVRAIKARVQGKHGKDSIKLVRTLFLIFVTFAVCWLPYAIIVVADVHDTFSMETYSYAMILAHTNSSLNSVLYGVTNRQFRQGYAQLFHIQFCKNKVHAHPQETIQAKSSNLILSNLAAPFTLTQTGINDCNSRGLQVARDRPV